MAASGVLSWHAWPAIHQESQMDITHDLRSPTTITTVEKTTFGATHGKKTREGKNGSEPDQHRQPSDP